MPTNNRLSFFQYLCINASMLPLFHVMVCSCNTALTAFSSADCAMEDEYNKINNAKPVIYFINFYFSHQLALLTVTIIYLLQLLTNILLFFNTTSIQSKFLSFPAYVSFFRDKPSYIFRVIIRLNSGIKNSGFMLKLV